MLLLSALAHAGPFFLSSGPETEIDVDRSGNWPRSIPTEDGWAFFFAAGGDFWYAPLDDALVPDLGRTRPLTGRSDLVDHAITRCPDGGFLHSASYGVANPDDSVDTYWYNGADLSLQQQATILRSGGETITRDMPLVCGETFRGLGLFTPEGTAYAGVTSGETELLRNSPMNTGSSWIESLGSLWMIGHDHDHWGDIWLRGYDEAFELHTSKDLPLVSEPLEAYWSQGLIQVGDYYVLAFMARNDSLGWQAQDGDVWLAVFNAAWERVETLQVTTNTPPVGAMQPGLSRKDDRLLVTYVRELQLYAVEVRIDVGLAAEQVDGTDEIEEIEEVEEADGAALDGPAGCVSGAGAGLFLLPLAWTRRRRGFR